jgi:transposase
VIPAAGVLAGGIKVLVATRPVDFRKGMGGLAALVQDALLKDPYSGVIYVFRAKRADRVKMIWWDGTGLWLLAKTLEQGAFSWPKAQDGVMRLTPAQLSALLEGLDWRRVQSGRRTRSPTGPAARLGCSGRYTPGSWSG